MISIIVPTYKREAILNKTLLALEKAIQEIECEVIVVNDDKDNAISLNVNNPKFKLYNNPRKGASAARNYGVEVSKGSLIVFIDNDILIEKIHLEKTIEFHKNNKKSCLNFNWQYPDFLINKMKDTQFGRFLLSEKLINYKSWYPFEDFQENAYFKTSVLASFYFSIEKEDFQKINGFNEAIDYLTEDDELSKRLYNEDFNLIIDSRYTVLHNEEDRIFLNERLARTKKQGQALKRMVLFGDSSYQRNYSFIKKVILTIFSKFEFVFHYICKLIPNKDYFDYLYFKIIHTLYAINIYKGYNNS